MLTIQHYPVRCATARGARVNSQRARVPFEHVADPPSCRALDELATPGAAVAMISAGGIVRMRGLHAAPTASHSVALPVRHVEDGAELARVYEATLVEE
jgi:hypothetical protein